ncbi:hypothetical protein PIB30_079238, partial [Stylosanthes scabra]|nr:hypothetical protein [Stylosanthes scabra]
LVPSSSPGIQNLIIRPFRKNHAGGVRGPSGTFFPYYSKDLNHMKIASIEGLICNGMQRWQRTTSSVMGILIPQRTTLSCVDDEKLE